jgi:hypothetical protein
VRGHRWAHSELDVLLRLRRQKDLASVRIFHFCSGREAADIDVTAVRLEGTCNQAFSAGHWSSVKQAPFPLFLRCLCRACVVFIRGRGHCAARAALARRSARSSFMILLSSASVRLWLLLRMRDRTAERRKKVLEGFRFRRLRCGQHSQDRQPDDNCAERSLHKTMKDICRIR